MLNNICGSSSSGSITSITVIIVIIVTITMLQMQLGITVGIAIALHNIPEGLCIALPVYFATNSKWQGLKLAILSGLAEPIGAMAVGYFMPSLLNEVW